MEGVANSSCIYAINMNNRHNIEKEIPPSSLLQSKQLICSGVCILLKLEFLLGYQFECIIVE
jgi:hypothetical protein